MIIDLGAVSVLLGSCALIVLVLCGLNNLRSWGKLHAVGDLPAGAALGFASVCQMFFPIEPYEGFIFDLRNVPIALAGAFLHWRAVLLAVGMAALARYGIGGIGMGSGILAIGLTAGAGLLWGQLRERVALPDPIVFFLLGVMTCCSLGLGLLLPEPVFSWFLVHALPVLGAVYLILVPALAWIADHGFVLERMDRRDARKVLREQRIELLGLPTFLHRVRVASVLDQDQQLGAVLSLRLRHVEHMSAGDVDTLHHAVVMRITEAVCDITCVGVQGRDTLLLPMSRDQLTRVEWVRDTIKDALRSKPFYAAHGERLWLSYDLGLVLPAALENDKQIVPRRIADAPMIDRHVGSWKRNDAAQPPSLARKRFEQLNNADMLFLKAQVLMRES